MSDYFLLIKLMHILSATVLMGTGAGIAFFLFMAHRGRDPAALADVTRLVVLADWCFTTPAVLVQLATGLMLMHILHISFVSTWFLVVATLFVFVGLCWLPVVAIQLRLRRLAQAGSDLPTPEFTRMMRYWTALGIPAFLAMFALFYMMVYKPAMG